MMRGVIVWRLSRAYMPMAIAHTLPALMSAIPAGTYAIAEKERASNA